jgi:two-component system cell cycle response regulator
VSLQSRLFLFFTTIVLVPLALAGFFAQRLISDAQPNRDRARVTAAAPGAYAAYEEHLASMPDTVAVLGADAALHQDLQDANVAALTARLSAAVASRADRLDFAVVTDPAGQVVAGALGHPAFLPGVTAPSATELVVTSTTTTGPPARAALMTIRTFIPILTGDPPVVSGMLVAGQYLDNAFAGNLASDTGIDITIALKAIASSLASGAGDWALPFVASPLQPAMPARATIGNRAVEAFVRRVQPDVPTSAAALVISTPVSSQAATSLIYIVLVLALAALGAAFLGFVVSGAIARPLRELAAGADAISAGHYEQHFDFRSKDEVGHLARAFNDMSARLSAHMAALHESREVLKRSLTRFGETLRSTHDLDKILGVVLDTSIDALRASAGLLAVVQPADEGDGDHPGQPAVLTVVAARGVDPTTLHLHEGEGIAGYVALTGEPLRLPLDPGDAGPPTVPERALGEAPFATGVWAPVFAQGRIFAVLCLFDREDRVPFTAGDLDTVLSLSDQAGVAIDNVMLHQEAQRLAITDAMTGIWNHRYFQLRIDQEMDRASRFHRPFCLVLFDIDDFKLVNDTHGHLVGNAVLIELARRVRSEVRDIDVLARYGGEEFVLILPETDAEGGQRAAEKIRQAIAQDPFGRDRLVVVTVSVGVATFPRDGADQTTLLRSADVALYEAKARGKNRTVLYDPSDVGRAASPLRRR